MTNDDAIFVLRMVYCEDKIKYPQKLRQETLGYFTDYKKAEYYISYHNKEFYWFLEDNPFKIFIIDGYGLNYFLLHYISRIYDCIGNFIGEHPSDYEHGYPGREAKDCRFKLGALVEFIDGNDTLDIGIVVGLPPNKARVKKVAK